MPESIQTIWNTVTSFFSSGIGSFLGILGLYLLLQLVILPRLGVST